MARNRNARNEWEPVVREFRENDLSIARFCQERKINKHTFQYWLSRMPKTDVEIKSPNVVSLAVRAAPQDKTLVLRMGDACELLLPAEMDSAWLASLLREIKKGCANESSVSLSSCTRFSEFR